MGVRLEKQLEGLKKIQVPGSLTPELSRKRPWLLSPAPCGLSAPSGVALVSLDPMDPTLSQLAGQVAPPGSLNTAFEAKAKVV